MIERKLWRNGHVHPTLQSYTKVLDCWNFFKDLKMQFPGQKKLYTLTLSKKNSRLHKWDLFCDTIITYLKHASVQIPVIKIPSWSSSFRCDMVPAKWRLGTHSLSLTLVIWNTLLRTSLNGYHLQKKITLQVSASCLVSSIFLKGLDVIGRRETLKYSQIIRFWTTSLPNSP